MLQILLQSWLLRDSLFPKGYLSFSVREQPYNNKLMMEEEDASSGPYTSVLLVCVYNRCSNIITHDMLYEIFSHHGEVMRILIFVKAKVWKSFIEMSSADSAKHAADSLNNTVLFHDGSKMIIFPSKLDQINFQNGNNGGVDYEELRKISQLMRHKSISDAESYHSSDRQNLYAWSEVVHSEPVLGKAETFSTKGSQKKSNLSWGELNDKTEEDEWFSPPKVRKRECTWNSAWYDIDAQFEQLALESEEYRSLVSRPKSKTIIPFNPRQEEYIVDNYPSRVLFLRSLMPYHTIKSVYHILSNFGNILKVIHMISKESMLVEFQHIEDASQAKDFLNLVKNGIKIFFSHYESLEGRDAAEDEELQQYGGSFPKREHFNPPSETLHVSYIGQQYEDEFLKMCSQHGGVSQFRWQKHQNNNKPMLLVRMGSMEESMKVMGFLQGRKVGTKYIKISFTRSKLQGE